MLLALRRVASRALRISAAAVPPPKPNLVLVVGDNRPVRGRGGGSPPVYSSAPGTQDPRVPLPSRSPPMPGLVTRLAPATPVNQRWATGAPTPAARRAGFLLLLPGTPGVAARPTRPVQPQAPNEAPVPRGDVVCDVSAVAPISLAGLTPTVVASGGSSVLVTPDVGAAALAGLTPLAFYGTPVPSGAARVPAEARLVEVAAATRSASAASSAPRSVVVLAQSRSVEVGAIARSVVVTAQSRGVAVAATRAAMVTSDDRAAHVPSELRAALASELESDAVVPAETRGGGA